MPYTVKLVYPHEGVEFDGGWVNSSLYDTAQVQPFTPGVAHKVDRESEKIREELALTAGEPEVLVTPDGEELEDNDPDPASNDDLRPIPVNDEGLCDAEIDITSRYTRITREKVDLHLSELAGLRGSEAFPVLLDLHSRLGDDVDPDPWKATEGNVKLVTGTLLGWTVQHPDARFLCYG